MSSKEIVTVANLQSFFYKNLSDLNQKSLCPVPEEAIYYSSSVLERYCLTHEFFEQENGRVQDKVLGIKLLEASQKRTEEQRRIYRDVGDTALMVCGYFSNSVNKKLMDVNYYIQLGQTAYDRMNSLDPSFMDIPSFYKLMASSFEKITTLIDLFARSGQSDPLQHFLLDDDKLKVMGITPNASKKVS
jgi:hypothetical protein